MAKKIQMKKQNKAKPKKIDGRTYDKDAVMNAIFLDVVDNKMSFNQAIEKSGISLTTFYVWLKENERFQKPYNYAREIRSDFLFEQLIEISDKYEYIEESETGVNEKGSFSKEMKIEAHRQRQLKIDTRKWVVARMFPKKYGDKVDVTTDGQSLNKVIFQETKTYEAKPETD